MSGNLKSIYLLKTSRDSMSQAESFLTNRKWTVGSGVNLRETLAYLIKNQPQFVLIAADHPSRKVKILPQLLVQAFPVRVIAFTESNTPSALGALREMGQPYNLFPPISGPAIQRMILKIEKDAETESLQRKNNPEETSSNNPTGLGKDMIRLKGYVSEEEAKQAFERAQAALTQLMNSKEDENLGPAYMPDHSTGSPLGSENKETQQGARQASSFNLWQEQKSKAHSHHDHASDWEGSATSKAPVLPGEMSTQILERSSKQILYVAGKEIENLSRENVVVRGSVEALDKSVARNVILGDHEFHKLTNTSNVTCIIIDTPRFSGYHLTVVGKNRPLEGEFLNRSKERLFNFLRRHGENVKEEISLCLEIDQVEFEAWALSQADFIRKSTHHDEEIAVAFFPKVPVRPKLETSESDKMFKISIDDIKENIAVEFDLYLFLPENKRFVLYTPTGKIFHKDQKDRLKSMGLTFMHLRRESRPDVQRYQAQNDLNQMIDRYKRKEKSTG